MKEIDFYFGPGSRYSYIAATQIARIAQEESVIFNWLPVCSRLLIQQAPFDPFASQHQRGQYTPEYRVKDAQRWARYYSIPFQEPDIEGVDWSSIIKACLAARSLGEVEAYSLTVFGDVFGSGLPPKSVQRLFELAEHVGLSATQFRVLFSSESIADQESAIPLQATANGVFGVPAFIVDGEVFWGQDRIPLLLHHLRNNR